jgi:hypothetical protein
MNENQTRIIDLLMHVTHRGKDLDTYGNKEAGGSGGTHEEVRYNLEKAPGSEGSLGGGTFHGKMGSRTNHRPYVLVFMDEPLGNTQVAELTPYHTCPHSQMSKGSMNRLKILWNN